MDVLDLIQSGKIKRCFRATRKLNAPNLVCHLTQRAAGKEPLFLEVQDYRFMLKLIQECSTQFSWNLYAFCLLPNHLHLLLGLQEENLYRSMQYLFSQYAQYFNRKYERKGHLFGGPYRQAVCLNDSYLLAASLYIHLNPVRARLVRDPQDYEWSSSWIYTEGSDRSWVDQHFILNMLSGDPDRGRERYKILLQEGANLKTGEALEDGDTIRKFGLQLASLLPDVFRRITRTRQVAKVVGLEMLNDDELENKIKGWKDNKPPAKPESRKAQKYLIEQLIARGFKRREIADRLGLSLKTVYNIYKAPAQ